MILHEMVHAYHHRQMKRIDKDLGAVYNKVMQTGKYNEVKYIYG